METDGVCELEVGCDERSRRGRSNRTGRGRRPRRDARDAKGRTAAEGEGTVGATRLVSALLEELARMTAAEEGGTHDASWLRGYVAGMANVAAIALELAQEGAAAAD